MAEKTASETGVLRGHERPVLCVGVSGDGRRALSGSWDNTVRVWDVEGKKCVGVLEGHTDRVLGVALSGDGRRAVSGSYDKTVRVWDVAGKKCVGVLEGHTDRVWGVSLSGDGRRAVSGSDDHTVRVWDVEGMLKVRGWGGKSELYTNAKVVLVGRTGVGKTGLALRLCENRWEVTESTHGMIVSQLPLGGGKGEGEKGGSAGASPSQLLAETEREVWLWDFAGQPDYRLIHQLYMDETALGVLVFDPQDENPFEDLGYWEKALKVATKGKAPKVQVAGRCDRGGIVVSKKRFAEFCTERGFVEFVVTGAKTGEGCEELKAAIEKHIPWGDLPWVVTTEVFKALKDGIVEIAGGEIRKPSPQPSPGVPGEGDRGVPGEGIRKPSPQPSPGVPQDYQSTLQVHDWCRFGVHGRSTYPRPTVPLDADGAPNWARAASLRRSWSTAHSAARSAPARCRDCGQRGWGLPASPNSAVAPACAVDGPGRCPASCEETPIETPVRCRWHARG